MENKILFIEDALQTFPQLSHASNIITKCSGTKNDNEKSALDQIIPEYVDYLEKMLTVSSASIEDTVRCKVEYLNAYYNFMHENKLEKVFTSQGKFRPTILEEFLFLLFKDFVENIKKKYDSTDVVRSGAVKAYSNLYFKARNFEEFIKSPEIGVNNKDQDYAIYRTFELINEKNKTIQIQIPAIAIEAKTYIDKTMLDAIIATAEKIKSGNPHTRFIAVAEWYDVSFAVDPAYSRIDQIYILRKTTRKADWVEIDPEVVLKLFNDTTLHFEKPWSDIEQRIKKEGVVI